MMSRFMLAFILVSSFVVSAHASRDCGTGWSLEGPSVHRVDETEVLEIDYAVPCISFQFEDSNGDIHTPYDGGWTNVDESFYQGVYETLMRRNASEMTCRSANYQRVLSNEDPEKLLEAGLSGFCPVVLRPGGVNDLDWAEPGVMASVPYGSEPDVHDALKHFHPRDTSMIDFCNHPSRHLDDVKRFELAYRSGIKKAAQRYGNGAALIAKKQVPDARHRLAQNGQAGAWFVQDDNYWKAFRDAGAFEDLAKSLQQGPRKIRPKTADHLVCTLEQKTGAEDVAVDVTEGTAGALPATCAAVGPACPELAVVVGAGMFLYEAYRTYKACYATPDVDVVLGQSCVENQSLEGGLLEANKNRCGKAVDRLALTGVALTGMGQEFKLLKERYIPERAALGGAVEEASVASTASRAVGREGSGVGATAEAAAESAPEVVVNGSLTAREWRTRGNTLAPKLASGSQREAALAKAGYRARPGAPEGFQKYCSETNFCITIPSGKGNWSKDAQREFVEAYSARASGKMDWVHPDARRAPAISSANGAVANPVSINRALESFSDPKKSPWEKTLRYMRKNKIADTAENRAKILEVFDGYLSREMSPLGTPSRLIRDKNGLRIVDAPHAEKLEEQGIPRYVIDHITVDHHNTFVNHGENATTTLIKKFIDPASPQALSPAEFNAKFRNFASDNVGDAFGLGRTVVRNADALRASPALRQKVRDVALAEDFGVFGPQLDIKADDTLSALLRRNDTLIPKTERTFADRVSESFGPKTKQAIEEAGPDYDRILFPKNQADRDYVKSLAGEFRSGVDAGIERAGSARIPVAEVNGKPAPIYLADTTALNAKANGTFEGWVTIPQYVRKIEANGAAPIERNFTFSGSDSAPTRSIFFANMPGRGTSLVNAPAGSQSFKDLFFAAEQKAITRRLAEGRLSAEDQVLARKQLSELQGGLPKLQTRPDGSLLFGPTYMTTGELKAFVQSDDALRALGYGERRAAARAERSAADSAQTAASDAKPSAVQPAPINPNATREVAQAPSAMGSGAQRSELGSSSGARFGNSGVAAASTAERAAIRRSPLLKDFVSTLPQAEKESALDMIAELKRRGISEGDIYKELSTCPVPK